MLYTIPALFAGHVLADTILQPGWLSRDKRSPDLTIRIASLGLHGLVHASFVLAVTGSPWLALAEWIVHPAIDNAKARGWFGLKVDQAAHLGCKLLWGALA